MGTSYSFISLLQECSPTYKPEKDLIKLFEDNPDECDLIRKDENGFLPLVVIIYFGMDDLALRIIDYYGKNDRLKLYTAMGNDTIRTKGLKFNIDDRCYADTPLTVAIMRKQNTVALKLLDYYDACNVSKTNNRKFNALMMSLFCGMTEIALKLLEHPDKIALGQVSEDGNTALMLSMYGTTLQRVRNKLLDNIDRCKLDQINYEGNTVLMCALISRKHVPCDEEYTEMIFKLLKYHTSYGLDAVNKNGYTALMIAIKFKLIQVAIKILEDIDSCKVNYLNSIGESALTLALDNDLCIIAHKIYTYDKHVEYLSLDHVNKLTKAVDSYKGLMNIEQE